MCCRVEDFLVPADLITSDPGGSRHLLEGTESKRPPYPWLSSLSCFIILEAENYINDKNYGSKI